MKKNAIIFGGSGDLGSAIIQDFLEKGFELVITYKDKKLKKLNNLKNKFRKYKKNINPFNSNSKPILDKYSESIDIDTLDDWKTAEFLMQLTSKAKRKSLLNGK